ncbi:MAG: hypothetical protein HC875_27670 [Anaerolineales bacterium]|nr:hypothetical protein [Anaerolineales bacterium]
MRTRTKIVTVTGPIGVEEAGITDAHTHVWIAPVPGTQPGLLLFDLPNITAELIDYREAGGKTLVDCQPGGCGRDSRQLVNLAHRSGVNIVACTGFHLKKYYPSDYWLYQAEVSLDEATAYFTDEIINGLAETREQSQPVRAGFIKVACEARLEDTPAVLLEATALASRATGAAIEVHTEKGAEAEKIVARYMKHGLETSRLVICHIDKRPDFGLHCELARAGVILEYDTFYRPKYQPEQNVWPLLERMVVEGLAERIALATDMAEASLWTRLGGGPGQAAFTGQIMPCLQKIGFDALTIERLMGGNIARCLAINI